MPVARAICAVDRDHRAVGDAVFMQDALGFGVHQNPRPAFVSVLQIGLDRALLCAKATAEIAKIAGLTAAHIARDDGGLIPQRHAAAL